MFSYSPAFGDLQVSNFQDLDSSQKGYFIGWLDHNLSRRFSKAFTLSAHTTFSLNESQTFTTLKVKKFLHISNLFVRLVIFCM